MSTRRLAIRHPLLSSLLLASAIVATGCGSSARPPRPPAPTVWKAMDRDQRMAYMKDVVLPRTKAAFVAFDPAYQDMDCKTCHGDGVDDGTYALPNPKIRPLPNSEQAFMAMLGEDADAAKITPFMANTLEPLMGELLQATVFDPTTMTGEFSCDNCHTLVDGEGKTVVMPKRGEP